MQTVTIEPSATALAARDRLALAAAGLRSYLSRAIRRRQAFARAVRELSAMSDRDLADIGIPRCDIHRIAREAAERA